MTGAPRTRASTTHAGPLSADPSRRARFGLALAVGLAALPAPLGAADLGARAPEPIPAPDAQKLWIVTLTGEVAAGPRFPGSDRFTAFGYPGISYRRPDEPVRFSAPDDGLSIALIDTPVFRFGPVARFQGGRYYSSDRLLFGLHDVRWTVEPGLFAEVWPTANLRGRVELRHGVHGHDGFVGNAGVDLVYPVGAFTFSLGPRLAWGDTSFTSTYFSVTPLEAALNGRLYPYSANGGITSVGALASTTYTWSPQWATTLYAGYNRLVGSAGDSPITRRFGSPNQLTFGARLSYSFTMPALF